MFRKNTDGSIKWNEDLAEIEVMAGVVALNRTVDASISSSTEVVLKPATTIVQVYAITKDVYLKWGADDVTASNFDEVIPAGQVFSFLVPEGVTALNVIEREASATVIIIEK